MTERVRSILARVKSGELEDPQHFSVACAGLSDEEVGDLFKQAPAHVLGETRGPSIYQRMFDFAQRLVHDEERRGGKPSFGARLLEIGVCFMEKGAGHESDPDGFLLVTWTALRAVVGAVIAHAGYERIGLRILPTFVRKTWRRA